MKQKIKPSGFGLRFEDYQLLLDYGMTNRAFNMLRLNPAKFFREFQRYTKDVPDEFKPLVYTLCFQAIDKNRASIESIVFPKKKERKEVRHVKQFV